MNRLTPQESQHSQDVDTDLREVFEILWKGKRLIFFTTLFFSIISIFYALSLPNIYRSEALLAPAKKEDNLMNAMQGLSGLAGLAGFSIPEGSASQSDQALEVLSSRSFFRDKIFPNINLPDLMADPRWDSKNNTLSYDNDLYDSKRKKWVRRVGFPFKVIPTPQESHEYFIGNVLNVDNDITTGFVTLSIDHVSPFVAKDWAELIINEINEQFRVRDHELALSSITYLNSQIALTNVVEVRQALSELLQNQMQTSMLTDANPDYVFSVLDPPVPSELKERPRRSIIVILATALGSILGALYVFIRNHLSRGNDSG